MSDISNRTAIVLVIFAVGMVIGAAYRDRLVAAGEVLWREPPAHVLQNSFTFADTLTNWCVPDRDGIRPPGDASLHSAAEDERLHNPTLAFYAWAFGLREAKSIQCRDVPPMIADAIRRAK